MADVPQRPGIARGYRWFLDRLERDFSRIVPWVHPSWYQLAALLLSVAMLFVENDGLKAGVVAFTMLLDWFDGAAARALKLTSRTGWMLDVTVDRLCEIFLFIPELVAGNWLWFAAALLNIGLSHYSVVTGKHRILPLRFFYVVLLLYRMFV